MSKKAAGMLLAMARADSRSVGRQDRTGAYERSKTRAKDAEGRGEVGGGRKESPISTSDRRYRVVVERETSTDETSVEKHTAEHGTVKEKV